MAIYGYLWLFMGIYGYLWLFMAMFHTDNDDCFISVSQRQNGVPAPRMDSIVLYIYIYIDSMIEYDCFMLIHIDAY